MFESRISRTLLNLIWRSQGPERKEHLSRRYHYRCHAGIHIIPNRLCKGKVLLKGLQATSKSHVHSDTPQRQPIRAEDPAEGRKKLQAKQKWLLSQIKGRPPWPGIWIQREILLSVEWWLEKQTSVEPRSYLTIRLPARVFYEQIVNSAAPRWLSLVENEGE